MRRLILAFISFFAVSTAAASGGSLRVTTWNMQWFPSGTSQRLDSDKEDKRISEAETVIKAINPDVALLQKIRDWGTFEKLVASLQPIQYYVAVCSAFRDKVGGQIGWQQKAIISKIPAQAAWSDSWKANGRVDPPRGFAFAAIQFSGIDFGFYSAHLKSNLTRGNDEVQSQFNILKRELAVEQITAHVKTLQRQLMPTVKAVVIGGDFNTNRDEPLFASERTLQTLSAAGFYSVFPGTQTLKDRVTHPANGKYPDATFDYLFLKGVELAANPKLVPVSISDHRPVTCEIEVSAVSRNRNASSPKLDR
jgi:endonuclease/exonuclease/phosphatase family metal-dependent hydrolase